MLNYQTGEEIQLPGSLDPIPFPDGKVMAIPLGRTILDTLFDTMEYYSIDKLIEGASHKEARIYVDRHLPGNYQTIGVLGKDADGTTHYRIVSESVFNHSTGFYTQKYAFNYGNKNQGVKVIKEGKSKKAQKICEGSVQFALPMQSKLGKYLSGVEPKTRNTKIMKILEDGTCEDLVHFDFPTGKLDFSYDDKEVAFHVDTLNKVKPGAYQHFLKPSKRKMQLQILTFSLGKYLEAKEAAKVDPSVDNFLTPVSACEGANCYYPTYLPSGDLVYLEQNKSTDDYRFVFMTQNPQRAVQSGYFKKTN
jgi:hypothetical protein